MSLMLSAIIYGRNDGYSYELNQLARQLAPSRDEIIFDAKLPNDGILRRPQKHKASTPVDGFTGSLYR